MKKLIILSLLALTFASCKNNTSKENKVNKESKTVATEKPSSLLQTGCYSYNANNNAINLEITSVENGVTGTLTYALDGKDSNSGTFVGKLEGNKLFGVYTFTSEGVESKREVAFLVKGNQLIEGYGELTESGDAFKNKNDIKFTSTMPLTKTDCDK